MPDLAHVNRTPQRTADLTTARALLERDGAVVVTGVETGSLAAVELARRLFEGHILAVPDAALVREGGVMDRRPAGLDHTVRSNAHTDGYAYGDRLPDHFLLVCEHHSQRGGQSILLDGYALLEAMAAHPATAWAAEALRRVPVDQTEEGMRRSVSPVVQVAPSGRLVLRRNVHQRPAAGSADPGRDAEMLALWEAAITAAVAAVPADERPVLRAGEALVIDNYRMLHGREPYEDPERAMWRVWVWTDTGMGVPEGLLHSDSRFAGAR